MNNKELYDEWVARVSDFCTKVGAEKDISAATLQSKPILDKQPDVVFLGYNANEDFPFSGVDNTRFYEGNPYFYKERHTWKLWSKLKGMFVDVAKYPSPVTDGNYVFMNAVYFGSNKISQMKTVHGSEEIISQCMEFTNEVIQNIFKPKCVVCFSIGNCFDNLDRKYKFSDRQTFIPKMENGVDATVSIKKGLWGGIPVYGVPHLSGQISWNNLGAIALYLKSEMQLMGI